MVAVPADASDSDEDFSHEVADLIDAEDLQRLGDVLDQGPECSVNMGRSDIYTPLMYAVYKNRDKTVAYLLKRGADVSAKSQLDISVFGVACYAGCPEIAELLLSHGAKLDMGERSDVAALERAFYCNFTRFLECVFSRGGVKHDRGWIYYKWLLLACEMASLTLVKCLLDQGLNVNATGHGVTPLTRACELGEVAIARELVERGAEIDLLNTSGKTAIMHACDQENVSMSVIKAIKVLLDSGAEVDAPSSDGLTALMLASQTRHAWTVRCLLHAGADVDLQIKSGSTALMLAAQVGLPCIVSCLLNAGANVNLQNEAGSTALMLACALPSAEVVELLLRAGARTEVRNEAGQTALIVTCAAASLFRRSKSFDCARIDCARMSIVELLDDSGANLDAQDAQGATALICAAERGHLRIVEDLLARGAKVDVRAKDGQTALMRCCDYGDTRAFSLLHEAAEAETDSTIIRRLMLTQGRARADIAAALLEHSAQVNLQDTQGSSPLLLACRESAKDYADGEWVRHTLPTPSDIDPASPHRCSLNDDARPTLVRQLLLRGANADLQGQHGYTALMHAVFCSNAEVIHILLSHGAAVNLRDCRGSTALMMFVRYGYRGLHIGQISFLLDGGASVSIQDNNGTTALMLAIRCNNSEVAAKLAKLRAVVNLQDSNGKTALMWAAQRTSAELCQRLIDHGASVDLQSNDGSTALMLAVDSYVTPCIKCLLAAHAKVDAQRDDGKTALMLAAETSVHYALVKLAQHRATLNQQTKDGMTALMLAVAKGDSTAAKILLNAGAAVNIRTKDGTTAFMLAAQNPDPALVKLLLAQDTISLDDQRKDCSTALMLACARGAFEGADRLICRGANVHLRDAHGRVALRILANTSAEARKSAKLLAAPRGTARLLVSRGAELDFSHIPNVNARAALAIACRQGYMEAIELLGDVYRASPSKSTSSGADARARKTRQRRPSRERLKTRKLS